MTRFWTNPWMIVPLSFAIAALVAFPFDTDLAMILGMFVALCLSRLTALTISNAAARSDNKVLRFLETFRSYLAYDRPSFEKNEK